jgi:predicted GIY-YIG superfamily endonuclease
MRAGTQRHRARLLANAQGAGTAWFNCLPRGHPDTQFVVYQIIRNATGECYIGVTNNLRRRMGAHAAKLMPDACRSVFLDNYTVSLLYGAETPIYNRLSAYSWEKLACDAATGNGMKFMPEHKVKGQLSGVVAHYTFKGRRQRKIEGRRQCKRRQ